MNRNEAIEIVRKNWPDGRHQLSEALETLIPELKESEDERIRKALIEHFKWNVKQILNDFDNKEVLAFLEKQSKKEYALKSTKDEDVLNKFVQYIERQAKAYELNLPNRSYDIYGFAKDILSWLEEQGEQKLFNNDKYQTVSVKILDRLYESEKELERLKQGEQKPVPFKAEHGKYYYCIKDYFSGGKKQASKGDVVQALRGLSIMGLEDASEFFLPVNDMPLNNDSPKFKVGDWVVLSSGSLSEFLQIVRIDLTSNYYWFDDGSFLGIVDEDCLHLWRPQDAEAGDILVTTKDGHPFIFKGFLDKFHPGCPVAYGGIVPEGIFEISSGDGWWDSGEISPANKEQRELLFREMKIAGYEWDAEKKELKELS